MPYIDETLLEEEEKEPQSQISSGSEVIGAGTPQTGTAPNRKGSGQFANLDEYLRVNKPNAFGEQLAGKVGEDVNKAGESLNQIGEQFKGRVDQSTVKPDEELVSRATSDPTKFVEDQKNVDDWNKLFNASYKGVSGIQDTPDLQSASRSTAETAAGKARASKSEGGRFALLDTYFGRPTYSSGQKSLDNLLAQNDENASDAFALVQKNAETLSKRQQGQGKEFADYANQAKATTEAARKGTKEALGVDETGNLTGGGAIGNVLSDIDTRVTDYGNKSADAVARDRERLRLSNTVGSVPSDLRELFGLSESDVAGEKITNPLLKSVDLDIDPGQYYGVDIEDYLRTPGDLNRATVSTAPEQARLRALERLGELSPIINPTGKSYTDPRYIEELDKAGFLSGVGARKQEYLTAVNKVLSELGPSYEDAFYNGKPELANAIYTAANTQIDQLNKQYGIQTRWQKNQDPDFTGNTPLVLTPGPNSPSISRSEFEKLKEEINNKYLSSRSIAANNPKLEAMIDSAWAAELANLSRSYNVKEDANPAPQTPPVTWDSAKPSISQEEFNRLYDELNKKYQPLLESAASIPKEQEKVMAEFMAERQKLYDTYNYTAPKPEPVPTEPAPPAPAEPIQLQPITEADWSRKILRGADPEELRKKYYVIPTPGRPGIG